MSGSPWHRGVLIGLLTLGALSLAISVAGAPPALASSPWWGVTSGSRPTNLVSGGTGQIVVTAENRGDAATSGEVTLTDELPAGLEAVGIEAIAYVGTGQRNRAFTCELSQLTCTFSGSLSAYQEIEMEISVSVKDAVSGEENRATVSGGGASRTVSASHSIEVDGREKFGVEEYELIPEDAGGSIVTQAGSHPFQLTSVLTLNTTTPDGQDEPRTVALPTAIVSELPTGLIANPTPFAQCTEAQFAQRAAGGFNACAAQSAVGVATLTLTEPRILGFDTVTTPIFNVTPSPGDAARFGFGLPLDPVLLDVSIRSGDDYGGTITLSNPTEAAWLLSVKLTFWGVPGNPIHDNQRGWECLDSYETCTPSTETNPPPFLVMPTSCEAPFQATLRGDSWGSSPPHSEEAEPVTYTLPEKIDGCDRLPFAPSIALTRDAAAASTPTGLNVDVHVPQQAGSNPEGLSESSTRDIAVSLPEGVEPNPGGADGLQACSESQVGFTGVLATNGMNLFNASSAEPSCPSAAKLGTVKITTPLLANPLEGAIYLATQNENPFGSLMAIYAVAEDPVSGTVVKLPGELSLNQQTGKITATFKDSPQLPFEDVELNFFGGERAPLATPARCGTYTAEASLLPWSGGEPVNSSSSLQITTGPNGGPCPGASLPFSPSLTAGTLNNLAGSSSPMTITVSREDGNQDLQSIQVHAPPGLTAALTGVPVCSEPQADEGTCGSQSDIGETTVTVGLGGDAYTVSGGKVYLTGPYEGAPFGLSIVEPAKAGPLDLENAPGNHPRCDCVVVRAGIEVSPRTAQLTIATDSTGPHAIPHIIDGVPIQIKQVNITIDRPGLTVNPTNCDPLTFTAILSSAEGASSAQSVPFQAADCANLKFAPKLTASTRAKSSRRDGASLVMSITAPGHGQANLAKIELQLPGKLPPRFSTIQTSCTAEQFAANPAGCPQGSNIGTATAATPLLSAPLTGPVYFVSHPGPKFPQLIMVLQSEGIALDISAETVISRAGATTITAPAVPDMPFTRLTLSLPEGPHSALAAPRGGLCQDDLVMPTTLTGQNGALLKQETKIHVTGCNASKWSTARKLAMALKRCRKKDSSRHSKGRREACERKAREQYEQHGHDRQAGSLRRARHG